MSGSSEIAVVPPPDLEYLRQLTIARNNACFALEKPPVAPPPTFLEGTPCLEEPLVEQRVVLHALMSDTLSRDNGHQKILAKVEDPGTATLVWLGRPNDTYPNDAVGLYTDTLTTTDTGVRLQNSPRERFVLDDEGTVYINGLDIAKLAHFTSRQHLKFLASNELLVRQIREAQDNAPAVQSAPQPAMAALFGRLTGKVSHPEKVTPTSENKSRGTRRQAVSLGRLSLSR